MPFAFAVMLIVETNDPRLDEETLATAHTSVKNTATMRRALLQHLPKDVQRVVAVFPVDHAKLLMQLHDTFGAEIAKQLGVEERMHNVAPPGYVPPTRE